LAKISYQGFGISIAMLRQFSTVADLPPCKLDTFSNIFGRGTMTWRPSKWSWLVWFA